MSNFEYCEKCGGKLEYKIKDSIQGIFCEKCGWKVVTTYISPLKSDPTIYQVFLQKNRPPTIEQIKTISHVCNRNYLEARQMLLETQTLIYEGNADSILTVVRALEKECLRYKIVPQFPYNLDNG